MTSAASNPAPPARLVALDGLRGLACLQVVIYHFYMTVALPLEWHGVLRRAVASIDGVAIFFTLSGFLIGGILLDHAKAPNLLQVFYTRRFFRIMPVYWLLLLSFVLVRALDNHWRWGLIQFTDSDAPFWHYLVFTQNNTTELGAMWLAVTWSLAVEEQFYLVFPFLVRCLSRWIIVAGALASLVISPLLRLQDPESQRLLVGSADQLMAGVLVALAVRHEWWQSRLRQNRKWLGLGLALYLVATISLAACCHLATAQWPLAVPAYALLVYLLATEPAGTGLTRVLRVVAPVGLGSYFIYLFHLPVAYVFSLWIQYPGTGTAALAVVAPLAWLSYRWLELPLISLGRKQQYQPPVS